MASFLSKIAIVFIALVAIFYQLILRPLIFESLGYGRMLTPLSSYPYQCRRIDNIGIEACEDMWLHEPTGLLYMACSDSQSRKEWLPAIESFNASGRGLDDRIGVIDTRGNGSLESRLSWLKVENFPGVRGDGTLNLHGFDIRQLPDSDILQIVLVNHRPPIDPITGEHLDPNKVGANSTIEVFETEVGSGKMTHVKTYADEAIQTPNRVTWTEGDTFVFTNDHSGKVGIRRALSPFIGGSNLGYCNQTECHIAAKSGFKLPNGLIMGKDSLLYIPDTATGEIYIYSIAFSPSLLPHLQFNTSIKLSYPIDNLSVDENGNIFAAAFPMVYKWSESAKNPFRTNPPSTVFKIRKFKEGEYEVEKILEDDGTMLPGVTIAINDVQTGRIFLGGVVSPFIGICEAI